MNLLVCIPTYNEIENIEALISAVFAQTARLESACAHILVIDDNSPDGTAAAVEGQAGRYPGRLHLLKRPEKHGLAQAYLAGFAWGMSRHYDAFLEMDADFSHDPAYIPQMAALIASHDVVIGSRSIKGGAVTGWPLSRRLISKGGSLYSRIALRCPVKDLTGGFVMWRKSALEAVGLSGIMCRGYAFQIEMKYRAFLAGLSIIETPIVFTDRTRGASKMSKKIVMEALGAVWKIRQRGRGEGALGQFIKFGLTGGLGTLTNLALFFLLADMLNLPPVPVSIVCFLAAVTQNYAINHLWTFKAQTAGEKLSFKRWGKYTAGALLGLAADIAVLTLILRNFTLPYQFIAQAFGIAAGMTVNFVMSKFVAFRKR